LMKRTDEHVRHGEEAKIVELLPQSVRTGRTIEDVEKGVTALRSEGKASDPMPEKVAPQLATLVDGVPRGDYIFEIKYDGYRALATLDRTKKKGAMVSMVSRNG